MKTASLRRLPFLGITLSVLGIIGVLGPLGGSAFAAVPTLLSYQGRVSDIAGNLVNSGVDGRTVVFKIYTVATGGTPIWAETQNVTIALGEFSVLIGNGMGIGDVPGPKAPASVIRSLADAISLATASSSALYLGVTVDDGDNTTVDAEISPRQQLVAGAFAVRALVADTVAAGNITEAMIGSSQVGNAALKTDAVTNGKIAASAVNSAKIEDGSVAAVDLAASSVTAAKIDTSTVGLWNPVGASGVYRGGVVGIGTNAPAFPLSFASVEGDKISLWGGSGPHYGLGIANSRLQIHCDGPGSDIAFGYGESSNMTVRMVVKGSGNVGIGTTNPAFPLDVTGASRVTGNSSIGGILSVDSNVGIGTNAPAFPLSFPNTLGDKISLWGGSGAHYGFGIAGSRLQIHCDTSGADIAFGYGQSNGMTVRMVVKGSGRVGINTTDPAAPLHVAGSTSIDTYIEAEMNTGGTGDVRNAFRTGVAFGAIIDSGLRASYVAVNSDLRLKKGVQRSDAVSDLKTLLSIEVSDYQYIDSLSPGSDRQKKVIAQQLESVYPLAVNKGRGVVPDIYKSAVLKNGWIQLKTDLKVGERVRIVSEQGAEVYEVLQVVAGSFRTDFTEEGRVFVYGREVEDLRSVDYDAVSMLNVSATQALYRQQEDDRRKISDLEARLAEIEKVVRSRK